MKLHLEIFHPSSCPKCICGKTIDPFARHIFCCRRVSKMIMHNRIRDNMVAPLTQVLKSAGIMGAGTEMEVEPKNVVPALPGLRPHDIISFRPTSNLKRPELPNSPFQRFGMDITITPPIGHVPPSRLDAANKSKTPAPAAKHLIEKERKKLMRNGMSDPTNHNSLTGEEIIQCLLKTWEILLPVAISPLGKWGPMFHYFLFGTWPEPTKYKFPKTRPNAEQMFHRATSHPAPRGIVPLATSVWKQNKPKYQYFYGHSYTTPTPYEFIHQQLGLAISDAIALHIRDAKLGTLTPNEDNYDNNNENMELDNDMLESQQLQLAEANSRVDLNTLPLSPPTHAESTQPLPLSRPPGFDGFTDTTTRLDFDLDLNNMAWWNTNASQLPQVSRQAVHSTLPVGIRRNNLEYDTEIRIGNVA